MGMWRMLPSKVCGGHRTSDVLIYVLLLLLATLTAIESRALLIQPRTSALASQRGSTLPLVTVLGPASLA